MTLEEMAALLAEMKTTMAANEAKAAEEREKLKGKIGELISEKKKLKTKVRQPSEDDEEGEEEEAPKSRKSDNPDLARVQREADAKLTKMQEQLDAAKRKADDAAIRTALSEALNKAGISSEYRSAVEALMRTKHKAEVAEDGAVLFDGKAVSDSVATWAKDEGRAFIKAPASGGSAANPSAPSGGVNPVKTRSKMSVAEKGAFIREHGQDAYAKLPS